MIEYNKIPRSYRKQAIINYMLNKNGASPDLGDVTVITELTINAKLLKKTDTSIARDAAGQRKN